MSKIQSQMSFKQRFVITLVATLAVALVHNYTSADTKLEPAPKTAIVQTAGR